ncbi:MAG: hypothetical protein QF659_02770 [Dehalococcoidia bacterium]|nr:hypothetical protein [Dehalococcoidia bacterium]
MRLDDELLDETKQLAARTGRTLTGVIEDALRAMLAGQQGAAERRLRTWVQVKAVPETLRSSGRHLERCHPS